MVVALIALFVALGGASYAALKVPKKSVGTKQLKNRAVTGKKIKNATITGGKLKPGVIPTDAATLNGLAANELVRTAVATSPSTVTKVSNGTVISTQITAPRQGFLVVNSSFDVSATDDDFAACVLEVDGASMPGSQRLVSLDVGTVNLTSPCATGSTIPIAPGAHTIELESQSADPGDVTYGRGSLQATFVAFGPNG